MKNWTNLLFLLFLFFVGCNTPAPAPAKQYSVRLVTPQGKVYQTYRLTTSKKLYIISWKSGQELYLGDYSNESVYVRAPIGWLIEYEEVNSGL